MIMFVEMKLVLLEALVLPGEPLLLVVVEKRSNLNGILRHFDFVLLLVRK